MAVQTTIETQTISHSRKSRLRKPLDAALEELVERCVLTES